MLWVSASMPVAAVIDAGSSMVSSGSASTASASRWGEKMMRLTWVTSSEITALRPTSLPVPAVVGMATKCGTGPIGRAPGISSSYSNRSPGWVAISAMALATSSAAPPPMPTIESAPCAWKAATPASTCDFTGLPHTPSNGSGSSPPAARFATMSTKIGRAPTPLSVTTSGRLTSWARRCSTRS